MAFGTEIESEVDMARDRTLDMESRVAKLEQVHGKIDVQKGLHKNWQDAAIEKARPPPFA